MRKLHRLNALILSSFLLLHIGNHFLALLGPEFHITAMDATRVIYRQYLIEILVIGLFICQIILGLGLIYARGRPRGKWAWAQVVSGVYIAFFLLQHIGIIIYLRITAHEFDTNFYWAASVVSADPLRWYFIPYYGLGLLALFVHIAAALHFRNPRKVALPNALIVTGLLSAVFIPLAFSGGLYEIELPEAHRLYLESMYSAFK